MTQANVSQQPFKATILHGVLHGFCMTCMFCLLAVLKITQFASKCHSCLLQVLTSLSLSLVVGVGKVYGVVNTSTDSVSLTIPGGRHPQGHYGYMY